MFSSTLSMFNPGNEKSLLGILSSWVVDFHSSIMPIDFLLHDLGLILTDKPFK